jgi:DNA/RNA-binding domain of Phe-tRNA-synthetase-like protein
MTTITAADHALLRASAFTTTLPDPLGTIRTPASVIALLAPGAHASMSRSEDVRAAVRDLLRLGGYKPTGRGKPASEYLVRASEEHALQSINVVVDVCNAVSLHSGLPISVVDTDLAAPPFRIAVADAGTSYVFNAGGQEIDVSGLLCLFDAAGPCANAVKDSQRTKTTAETRRTLSVIWGAKEHEDRLAQATEWYRAMLHDVGAMTEVVPIQSV